MDYNQKQFDLLKREIYSDYGIILDFVYSEYIHDRYIYSDSGYVAKLSRGLNIYKSSTSLASLHPETRKVMASEITIFSESRPK